MQTLINFFNEYGLGMTLIAVASVIILGNYEILKYVFKASRRRTTRTISRNFYGAFGYRVNNLSCLQK